MMIILNYGKSLFMSKHLSLLVYICDKFQLEGIKLWLKKDIDSHKLFTELSMIDDTERVTKYITNPVYRYYTKLIVIHMFDHMDERVKSFINVIYDRSLFYSIDRAVQEIHMFVASERIRVSYELRQLAINKKINSKFITRYLVWSDIYYITMEQRINSLKKNRSVIHALYEFLFIFYDFIKIYEDQIVGIINNINGDIKTIVSDDRLEDEDDL